jgi:hypothetical protein
MTNFNLNLTLISHRTTGQKGLRQLLFQFKLRYHGQLSLPEKDSYNVSVLTNSQLCDNAQLSGYGQILQLVKS